MLVNFSCQNYSKLDSHSYSSFNDKNILKFNFNSKRASLPVTFLSFVHKSVRSFSTTKINNSNNNTELSMKYSSLNCNLTLVNKHICVNSIVLSSNTHKQYNSFNYKIRSLSSSHGSSEKNKYTHTLLLKNNKFNKHSNKNYNLQNYKSKNLKDLNNNKSKWTRKNKLYLSNAQNQLFRKFKFFNNNNLKIKFSNRYNLKMSESYLKLLKRYYLKFFFNSNGKNHINYRLNNNNNRLASFYLNRGLRTFNYRSYSTLKNKLFKRYLFTRYWKYYTNLELNDMDKSLELLKAKENFYKNKDLENINNKDYEQVVHVFEISPKGRKLRNISNKEESEELKFHRYRSLWKLESLKFIKSLVDSKNFSSVANKLNLIEKPNFVTENNIKEIIGEFILNYLKRNKVMPRRLTVLNNSKNLYWNWNFNNYSKDINNLKFFNKELEYRAGFFLGFNRVMKNDKFNLKLNAENSNNDIVNSNTKSFNKLNVALTRKKFSRSAAYIASSPLQLDYKKSNIIFLKKNNNNIQINVKKLKTRLPIFIGNNSDLLTKTEKGNIELNIIYNLANNDNNGNFNSESVDANGSVFKNKLKNLFDKEDRVNIVEEYEYKNNDPRGLKKDQNIFSKFKYNKTLLYSIKHISWIRKKYFGREFRIWKSVLNYSRKKRFKKLILNSYIYKKNIINHFASMPYLNRFLLALKISRKLNDISKQNSQNKKIELNSKIFYNKIYQILGINLNEFNILEMNNISNKSHNLAPITLVNENINNNNNNNNTLNITNNKNILGLQNQDNYIVNNLLLQKLIISNYNVKDLRSKLLRYRLSFVLKDQNLTAQNNNNLKIRKAVINLYKGSVNNNGFKVISGSGNNANVQFRNNNLINKFGKVSDSHNESPNIRNLRIILQRLIISKFKFGKGFNNGLNLKLLPVQNQNQKENNNKANTIYTNKKNKSNKIISNNINKEDKFIIKKEDKLLLKKLIDTDYNQLKNSLELLKENRKIRRTSKNLSYNTLYRFKLWRNKRQNLINNTSSYASILRKSISVNTRNNNSNKFKLFRLRNIFINAIKNIFSEEGKFNSNDKVENFLKYMEETANKINRHKKLVAREFEKLERLKLRIKNNKSNKLSVALTRNTRNKKFKKNHVNIPELDLSEFNFEWAINIIKLLSKKQKENNKIKSIKNFKSETSILNNSKLNSGKIISNKKTSNLNIGLRKNYTNYMLENFMLNLVRYQDNTDFLINNNLNNSNNINPINYLSTYWKEMINHFKSLDPSYSNDLTNSQSAEDLQSQKENNQILLETNFIKTHLRKKMPFLTLSNRLTNTMSNVHLKSLLPIRYWNKGKKKFLNRQHRLYFKRKRKKIELNNERKQTLFMNKYLEKKQDNLKLFKQNQKKMLINNNLIIKNKASVALTRNTRNKNKKISNKIKLNNKSNKQTIKNDKLNLIFNTNTNNRASEYSTAPLYLYNNNYKVMERNITNYKFKTTPSIIDFKKNTFNRMNFSIYLINIFNNPVFNENDGLNSTWLINKNNASDYTKKLFRIHFLKAKALKKIKSINTVSTINSVNTRNKLFVNKFNSIPSVSHNNISEQKFLNLSLNKNKINGGGINQKQAIINYWLLEQDKQNKRSYMNPHLSLLNNNRASSYQHRINFLKVNQLGFLHSKGFIKKNTIINTFLDKLIQFNKYSKSKHYKTIVKINNITEFIKKYNSKHKKGYVKKNLSDDIIRYKIRNLKKFYAANSLRIGDYAYDKYMDHFYIRDLLLQKINIFKNLLPVLFLNKKRKKNIMGLFVKICLRKLALFNKLNKVRKELFKLFKSNILVRKNMANKKINSVYKYNCKKFGKAKANSNNRFSFLFIYLFLIEKKTALINFKIHFEIDSLLRKNLIKGVQQGLIRTYGKKTLKALGIKNKKRNKYNKILVFIEKNFIAHTPNTLLKYLLILKWKRQFNFKNYELLNWNYDYFNSKYSINKLFKKNYIKNITENNSTLNNNSIINNNIIKNNEQEKTLSFFEREKIKKNRNKHQFHGINILYTSVFKKIKNNKDRNRNRIKNKRKNRNREANKIKKEKQKEIRGKEKQKDKDSSLVLNNNNNNIDIVSYYNNKLNNISNKSYLNNWILQDILNEDFNNLNLSHKVYENLELLLEIKKFKWEFFNLNNLIENKTFSNLISNTFDNELYKLLLENTYQSNKENDKQIINNNIVVNKLEKLVKLFKNCFDNFNTQLDNEKFNIINNKSKANLNTNKNKLFKNYRSLSVNNFHKHWFSVKGSARFNNKNKLHRTLKSIRYTKALNSFDSNSNSNNFLFNNALAYLGKYYFMNYYANNYNNYKLTASRYKNTDNTQVYSNPVELKLFILNNNENTEKAKNIDYNSGVYAANNNFDVYADLNNNNTNTPVLYTQYTQKEINESRINHTLGEDLIYSWTAQTAQNRLNINNVNSNGAFNLVIKNNNNHFFEFNNKFKFIVPSRKHSFKENILRKGIFNKNLPSVSSSLKNNNKMDSIFKLLENNLTQNNNDSAITSVRSGETGFRYSYNGETNNNTSTKVRSENLELSGSLSPFFDFLVDNKKLNKKNRFGLRKILSEFKFFRYFKECGSDIKTYQVINYSFTKNISRANTLNSLDYTGSLLKVNISVILKYFFKLMGSSLISKPFFIFSPNKVTIQISYLISKKLFLSNSSIKDWNEIVSTLSAGMQFYWPVSRKKYRSILKKDMPESGSWPSYWRMKNYYLNTKPFDEKVEPVYPGNMPFLSQMIYDEYVFRKIRQANRMVGKYWDHEEKRYVKRNIEDANIDKVLYTIPYVKNILSFFYKELSILTYLLEKFFNCNIKLELNRLKSPYSDTNIMAQLVGINGEENNFEKIKTKFFDYYTYCNPNSSENNGRFYINSKPFRVISTTSPISQLGGYKYRVAGRFYKHRIIPRKTVSSIQRGSMARGVVNVVDKARYINKSKRGSFSVTVWISHIF